MPDTLEQPTEPDSNQSRVPPPEKEAGSADDGHARRRKWLRRLAVAILVLGLGWVGYRYREYTGIHIETSDAYLHAYSVRISPQVEGRVLQVPVKDQEHVKQGQLLLEIDPAPFKIAVEQAQAQLDLAKQQAAAAQAAVDAANAQVDRRQALLKNARSDAKRTLTLVRKGTLSQSQGDNAKAALKEAQANLDAAQADLRQAQKQLGAPGAQNARIRAAAAALDKAKLDLSYTRIDAPAAGIVSQITVRPGDMVQPGQALFPLVEDQSYWVDANYKETDLKRIQPGQPAKINIDMYPDKTFHGTVDSISPASGTAFSLLPPENATGNWVKVTQRFPVRVRILNDDPNHPLRVGATCAVTIDTSNAKP